MPARERASDHAAIRARADVRECGADIRTARISNDASITVASSAAGISPAEWSRVEHGLVPGVPLPTLARMAAVVGLELRLRSFPGGRPVRDAPQLALLEDFHREISELLGWATEVLMPGPGDLRAWDALITGRDFKIGVDAETRLRDVQAVQRRMGAKKRDSMVDHMLLVLRDSRWNRAAVQGAAAALGLAFPVAGGLALAALREGRDPGGDAFVLI